MQILNKTLFVKTDTKSSDLTVGDLVITAEIHRVKEIRQDGSVEVVTVKPGCHYCDTNGFECEHSHIMEVGWGQLSVAKIIED